MPRAAGHPGRREARLRHGAGTQGLAHRCPEGPHGVGGGGVRRGAPHRPCTAVRLLAHRGPPAGHRHRGPLAGTALSAATPSSTNCAHRRAETPTSAVSAAWVSSAHSRKVGTARASRQAYGSAPMTSGAAGVRTRSSATGQAARVRREGGGQGIQKADVSCRAGGGALLAPVLGSRTTTRATPFRPVACRTLPRPAHHRTPPGNVTRRQPRAMA